MVYEKISVETDQIREVPIKGAEGFRLAVFEGGELAATYTYTRITKTEDLPDLVREIIKKNDTLGIPTFFTSAAVVDKFQGKGVGTSIRKEALRRLLSKYPKVIGFVIDESISPSSDMRMGWTERRVEGELSNSDTQDYSAALLLKGESGEKPFWLIEYERRPAGQATALQEK